MNRKRIIYILLSLLILSSLLVAGCSCDGVIPPAGEGGTLSLYGIDPYTLDPAVSGEMTSHVYLMQIFSGLVRFGDNLEPAPDIAERWEVTNDGRTYTFYLRQDVKFHDGRKLTADDFKYSWERACAPLTGSFTAATYLGDIVGVGEVLAGQATEISGVRVINDYTLEVTIDAPKSYFLSKLTYPTAFVVDRANVESGGGWWHSPNGTGPFKLKQWRETEVLILERNELYYGGVAKLNLVVFLLWSGIPMNMYETGEIDVAGVGASYIEKVTDETGPFYMDLSVVPELSFYYIGFNTARPPFDDVNIRRAFSQALDKDKLVSLVFKGTMEPADGILPPGMPGYNESLSGLEYDVEGAKELIAESSYGDVSRLPPITITTIGRGGAISSELEAVVYQWRENLGVEVTVRQLEPERFLYHLAEEKDEMFSTGWIADYPHPQDFLDILFHSGADNNYGEYSNPGVDALLEAAGVEQDSNSSLELYRQAEQMLVDDAACIPLSFGRNYVLVKPYVKGYETNPMGFAMLNEVSLEFD
ncbi:MAG: peptide ABC transporter substrate-binding protein [Deltaproteobacteria bacterium]|nr:peptide ABC transporter substrate-binding protein [Deltaproteobacteria bacterium]